jgi:hypothetical protein
VISPGRLPSTGRDQRETAQREVPEPSRSPPSPPLGPPSRRCDASTTRRQVTLQDRGAGTRLQQVVALDDARRTADWHLACGADAAGREEAGQAVCLLSGKATPADCVSEQVARVADGRGWAPNAAAWRADVLARKLEDELSLEGDARAQLAQAAGNVVALLASVTAWHEEAGDAGRARRQGVFRSLGPVFNDCVSFDDGLPPWHLLEQLIVEGSFNAQLLARPPKPKLKPKTKLRGKRAPSNRRTNKQSADGV